MEAAGLSERAHVCVSYSQDIGNQVEILAKQYPLTLPAWFALIIRTFSALEGLGLSLDDRYRSGRA